MAADSMYVLHRLKSGTVLGLFALSFLGFAITELWGERIEKELGQRKLFKRMKAQGEEHKKNAHKKAYLADEYGVEEEDAEIAFSTDKRAFKKIVEDSRRPRRS